MTSSDVKQELRNTKRTHIVFALANLPTMFCESVRTFHSCVLCESPITIEELRAPFPIDDLQQEPSKLAGRQKVFVDCVPDSA